MITARSLLSAAALALSLAAGASHAFSITGAWSGAKAAAAGAAASAVAGAAGAQVVGRLGVQLPDAAPQVNLPQLTGNFGSCAAHFFGSNIPEMSGLEQLQVRALCFDGFAVLHSGVTKTPLYVAEVLTRQRIQAARDEARTDVFFSDARLPARERATLEDYRGSGYDRGHMAAAANMDTPQAMAQSFSLANIVPQSAELNRNAWAKVEIDTRRYVMRAKGPVYVITAPVFASQPVKTIGVGRVWVPTHMFKLVYDPAAGRAWAHWSENSDAARIGAPISYQELVRRTGVNWLPGM